MLLKADVDGPAWTDARIADAFSCRTKTVENVRQRFVALGFERTLDRKKSPTAGAKKLLDGKEEAKVIAMRLGSPPSGYADGRCGCLPVKLWNWRSSKRSVMKQFVKR